MRVLTCTAPGYDQGQGYPDKTPHMLSADALTLLNMHRERRHPPDPELAKEQALRVNTKPATSDVTRCTIRAAKKDTKMQIEPELECTAHCTLCPYKTPQLESELAVWLLELHWASSPSCTSLTDSVQLPSVPSITARDTHGLLTKSLPERIRIKSSAEAAIKPETRCSRGKPTAGHEIPAQLDLPKSATRADKPVTSDMARWATKATKTAKQRDAKYGPQKLLLAQTLPEKQVTLKKDPTDSMQLPTKSPQDGSQVKSSIAEASLLSEDN